MTGVRVSLPLVVSVLGAREPPRPRSRLWTSVTPPRASDARTGQHPPHYQSAQSPMEEQHG